MPAFEDYLFFLYVPQKYFSVTCWAINILFFDQNRHFLRHQKNHVQNFPVKFLKQNGSKTNDKGFIVSKNFELVALKNIYIPGILARGFNPERKTIIKAILENSNIAGQSIAKTLTRI